MRSFLKRKSGHACGSMIDCLSGMSGATGSVLSSGVEEETTGTGGVTEASEDLPAVPSPGCHSHIP